MDIEKKDTAVIFDFDGTLCYLFANFNLQQAGKTMTKRMKQYSIDFSYQGDLFRVFDAIKTQAEDERVRQEALIAADLILAKAEIEAASSADFVPGAEKMLALLMEAGIPVGIATNNAPESVRAALARIGNPMIPVTGRIPGHPEKLKPDPDSLQRVLTLMSAHKENAVFVGDTLRDLQTAKSFGIPFIAIGSTDRKFARLAARVPEAKILKSLDELPSALEKLCSKEKAGCRSPETAQPGETMTR